MRTTRAVVFDVDGVLIDTARIHARAWKETFDAFLSARGIDDSFLLPDDYRLHVDGRPRYEGVSTFLGSRGIELAQGTPDDEPGFSTVSAIGNHKNETFRAIIEREEVTSLPGVENLLATLHREGVPMAAVSSSRNAIGILPDELKRRLEVTLGGEDLDELGLPGKPDPAMFLEATERLGVEPGAAAVVEDAPAGVMAGRRGGFGLVVGIGTEMTSRLREAGADVVVTGLGDLPVEASSWIELVPTPGSAIDSVEEIAAALGDRPAVFLDYDGTLTPIVDDPARATIGEGERNVLSRLASRMPVAVVSGRGLDDVRSLVEVPDLVYAGSHGCEIVRPDGNRFEQEAALQVLPDLDRAERFLNDGITSLDGVVIERKRFAIAVHTRRAATQRIREEAGELAKRAAGQFDRLVLTGGKEIHELRPRFSWNKGTALSYLLDVLPERCIPLYIGDDTTDEDAFSMLHKSGEGIGILVGEVDSPAETWATHTLADTDEVLEFLARLAEAYD